MMAERLFMALPLGRAMSSLLGPRHPVTNELYVAIERGPHPRRRPYPQRPVPLVDDEARAEHAAREEALLREQEEHRLGDTDEEEDYIDDVLSRLARENLEERNMTAQHRDVLARLPGLARSMKYTRPALLRRYVCPIRVGDFAGDAEERRALEAALCAVLAKEDHAGSICSVDASGDGRSVALTILPFWEFEVRDEGMRMRRQKGRADSGGLLLPAAVAEALYGHYVTDAAGEAAAVEAMHVGYDWVDLPSYCDVPISLRYRGSAWAPLLA